MDLANAYLQGLKKAYEDAGQLDEWSHFESIKHGASEENINKIKSIYPECPETLIKLLKYVDGTYHRTYQDEKLAFYMLGSDVFEYPYYLLSSKQIIEDENVASTHFDDYIDRCYDEYEYEVEIDEKIINKSSEAKWLHFSDCMNNGGTSQLFIDFTPSEKGNKGQIVRFLHDPDELKVIATSFDEYLEKIMSKEYDFIIED